MQELCENLVELKGSAEALKSFCEIMFKNNCFSMENLDIDTTNEECFIFNWGTVEDAMNVEVKVDDKRVSNLIDLDPKNKIFIKYDTEISPNIEFWDEVNKRFSGLLNIGHVYYSSDLEYAGINIYKHKKISEYYIENSHSNYKKSLEYFEFIYESNLEYEDYIKKYFSDLISESKITLSDIQTIDLLNNKYDFKIKKPSQIICSIEDINNNIDNYTVPTIEE